MTAEKLHDGDPTSDGNAVCDDCRKPFHRDPAMHRKRPTPVLCYGCWYGRELDEARKRFEPLVSHLARLLEIEPAVDQTGGMVMCLGVHWQQGGRPGDANERWVWFSEAGEGFGASFGFYGGVDGEQMGWFEAEAGVMDTRDTTYDTAGVAVAEWAAPLILGLVAGKGVVELGGDHRG